MLNTKTLVALIASVMMTSTSQASVTGSDAILAGSLISSIAASEGLEASAVGSTMALAGSAVGASLVAQGSLDILAASAELTVRASGQALDASHTLAVESVQFVGDVAIVTFKASGEIVVTAAEASEAVALAASEAADASVMASVQFTVETAELIAELAEAGYRFAVKTVEVSGIVIGYTIIAVGDSVQNVGLVLTEAGEAISYRP